MILLSAEMARSVSQFVNYNTANLPRYTRQTLNLDPLGTP